MDFNSLEFVAFVAAFFLFWPLVRKNNTARWTYLTVSSLFFYSWGFSKYVWLLLLTGLIDYSAGIAMERFPNRKKLLLWLSLASNLGALAAFKYVDFVIYNINTVMSWTSPSTQPMDYLRLGLPLGISFYTFESMSYTIDVYRGRFKPTHNILKFYAFLALFPRLAAGPIVRASTFIPQLDRYNPISPMKWWSGTRLIVYGLFKKAVIADQVAGFVDEAFIGTQITGSTWDWWFVLACFGVQLYADFSGYSDIGRGLGKWMGLEFPVNFNHPFYSETTTRYYSRWHMSLMAWFRDYLYYPLAGKDLRNRRRAMAALIVTYVVSGFWHGAAWTFMCWGGWFVMILAYERLTGFQEKLMKMKPIGPAVASIIAMLLITPTGVFFRATDVSQAFSIIGRMFAFDGFNPIETVLKHPFEVACVLFVHGRTLWFRLPIPERIHRTRRRMRVYTEPLELATLLVIAVFLRGPGHNFVYFQF